MTSDFSVALAGSVSAAVSTVSVYPLDTIKTYLNRGYDAEGKPVRSAQEVLALMLLNKNGALKNLYAGLESKIFMSTLLKFISFYSYNFFLRLAKKRGPVSVLANLVVGYVSALVAVGILTPLEIAQTRQQLNPSEKRSIVSILLQIYTSEGIKGLYRGFETNIILCVNPAIDFSIFDQVRKRRLAKTGKKFLSDFEAFWLGALSKAVATVITFPHVRAKVLQQAGDNRFRNMSGSSILINLLLTDGFTSWFAGMKAQLMKNILAAAILMSVKERIEHSVLSMIKRK